MTDQLVIDEGARADSAPVALYAFPARAWHRREYAALQASVPTVAVVSEPGGMARWACDSIVAMGLRYANAIELREKAKGRPVALFGWSVGAIVAQEVARRLERALCVAWIGIVDITVYAQLHPWQSTVAALDGVERNSLDESLLQWLRRSAMRNLWDRTLNSMSRLQYDTFLREVVRAYGTTLPNDGPEIGSVEHSLWSRVNCLRLCSSHAVGDRAAAPVHVWMSEEMANIHGSRTEGVEVIVGSDHKGVLEHAELHGAVRRELELQASRP